MDINKDHRNTLFWFIEFLEALNLTVDCDLHQSAMQCAYGNYYNRVYNLQQN